MKVRARIIEPADLEAEVAMHRRFHNEEPTILIRTKHPKPPKTAVVLGKLKSVIYEKCSGDHELFIHDLSNGTLLAAGADEQLIIVNSKTKISRRGIIG